MSKVFKRGPANAQMNMTPLIDVTFQLIIFFLLVNNIVSAEAVEMIVPDLERPATRELGEVDRVVINISPMPFDRNARLGGNANPLNFTGEAAFVQIGMDQYAIDQLEPMRATLKELKESNPDIEVLLRADAALYYSTVQPVMDVINGAGISTINLVAMIPEENRE